VTRKTTLVINNAIENSIALAFGVCCKLFIYKGFMNIGDFQ